MTVKSEFVSIAAAPGLSKCVRIARRSGMTALVKYCIQSRMICQRTGIQKALVSSLTSNREKGVFGALMAPSTPLRVHRRHNVTIGCATHGKIAKLCNGWVVLYGHKYVAKNIVSCKLGFKEGGVG